MALRPGCQVGLSWKETNSGFSVSNGGTCIYERHWQENYTKERMVCD